MLVGSGEPGVVGDGAGASVGEIVEGLSKVVLTVVVGIVVVGPRLVGLAVEGLMDAAATVDREVLLGALVHASTLHAMESVVVGQAGATPTVDAEATILVLE